MITDPGSEGGVVFIADTAKEAKAMGVGHDAVADCDFIDIRVKWLRNIDITGLEKGEIGLKEGIIRGAYYWVTGIPCPHCGDDSPELMIYQEWCEICEPGPRG